MSHNYENPIIKLINYNLGIQPKTNNYVILGWLLHSRIHQSRLQLRAKSSFKSILFIRPTYLLLQLELNYFIFPLEYSFIIRY